MQVLPSWETHDEGVEFGRWLRVFVLHRSMKEFTEGLQHNSLVQAPFDSEEPPCPTMPTSNVRKSVDETYNANCGGTCL